MTTASAQFAACGYNGASTRDIAAGAGVNEVTIYRHFPRKRNLYLAVLEAELGKVTLRGDHLARVAEAADGHTAMVRIFELLQSTLSERPDLLRLLHYGSLELSEDLDSLLRKHLGEQVKVLAHYLEPWVEKGQLRRAHPQTVVLALIAIVFMVQPLGRIFPGPAAKAGDLFAAFTEICIA